MRYLLAAVLAITGCASQPAPTADDYTPTIAVAIGIASKGKPAPKPEPKPTPGICQNCDGTGKLGDGTVFVDCVECDGTGRITAGHVPKRPGCEVFPEPKKGGDLSAPKSKAKAPIPTTPPTKQRLKLTLTTARGTWCEPCLRLKAAIKSNKSGVLDLLRQHDVTVVYVDASQGPVPRFQCGKQSFIGGDVAALTKWIEKQQ